MLVTVVYSLTEIREFHLITCLIIQDMAIEMDLVLFTDKPRGVLHIDIRQKVFWTTPF